jgi:hypothetical protein
MLKCRHVCGSEDRLCSCAVNCAAAHELDPSTGGLFDGLAWSMIEAEGLAVLLAERMEEPVDMVQLGCMSASATQDAPQLGEGLPRAEARR